MTNVTVTGDTASGRISYTFPGDVGVTIDGTVEGGEEFIYGKPGTIRLSNPDRIISIEMTMTARRAPTKPHIMVAQIDEVPKPRISKSKPDPQFYTRK